MEPVSVTQELEALFTAHDVAYQTHNEWLIPLGTLPAIRATWYPREDNGVLEVEVLLEDQRIILESFAGTGAGKEGLLDSIQSFCVNSFHVMLAAFWGVNDPDQVMVEQWSVCGKTYRAYIGNIGVRSSHGVEPSIPDGLFEAIENAAKSDSLEEPIVWFRCFFGNLSGEQTFEALKNNDDWATGLSALKALEWQRKEGYYGVRNFLIAREEAATA